MSQPRLSRVAAAGETRGGGRPPAQMYVLGVLAEEPSSGYRLRQVAQQWGVQDWAGFGGGSIYNALARLARECLVEEAGTRRTAGYAPATVFAITETGKQTLREMVRSLALNVESRDPFDLTLAFFHYLPSDEREELLRSRVDLLRERKAAIEEERQHHLHHDHVVEEWPLAIIEKESRLVDVLIAWTESLIPRAASWTDASHLHHEVAEAAEPTKRRRR